MSKRVFIIGGGAAGLTAAIAAAREGGAVTVLEHGRKAAGKLLATGNGKCNLGNRRMDAGCYHSPCPEFVSQVLAAWDTDRTVAFFTQLGVHIKEKGGYLYPYSEQASCVRELLLLECQRLKVKMKQECEVEDLTYSQGLFKIHTPGWIYEADRVILATGSDASNVPGADQSGCELAARLGHHIRPFLPALVPLICKGLPFSKWAGVRMEGQATLYIDGLPAAREEGELQMTDSGISGIPIFQLSGQAVRALAEKKEVNLTLDLMPHMTLKQLEELMDERKAIAPHKSLKQLYLGLLPDKIISLLPRENPLPWLKSLPLKVVGSKSREFAQVASGGVSLREVDHKTMESKICPGLYFAGELLDVDGICGGYNLHWAWATGYLAGVHGGREKL